MRLRAWHGTNQAFDRFDPDKMGLANPNDASRRGDHDLSERLYLEAEEAETRALQAEPAGARVLLCEVTLENPLEVDGTSRAVVTDLGAVLQAAKYAGHDGVIIRDIADTPAGAFEPDDHVAVFDTEAVRILEVRLQQEPEPEPDF